MAQELLAPISIRYDGLDADRHELDLNELGESIQGVARIIGVVANFVCTGEYVQHFDALQVRVLARASDERCFTLAAVVTAVQQYSLLSGAGTAAFGGIITYVFSRLGAKRQEMKLLSAALERAIDALGAKDQAQTDRMMTTIEKMAEALRPAARQATKPIGLSCNTLSIGDAENRVTWDRADKEAISSEPGDTLRPTAAYDVLISELDMKSGTCRVSLPSEPEKRLRAEITDPQIQSANNVYALALAEKKLIKVLAKALMRDGMIEKLYISDIVTTDGS